MVAVVGVAGWVGRGWEGGLRVGGEGKINMPSFRFSFIAALGGRVMTR